MSAALSAVGAAMVALAWAAGCAGDVPKPLPATIVVREIPAVFRGTVGSEVAVNGAQATLVSGYGLVVGLRGTGGQVLPDRVAASMEREMGLKGVSKTTDLGNSPFSNKSPREVLRDPNVAVVVVTAAIPSGLPDGARFDVYVKALNASSLDGGRLFSTDLRIGPAAAFGTVTSRLIGSARGPVFVNPFSEPGKEDSGVNEQVGRVLNGGVVTEPLLMELVMDQASHQRARAIVSAINSRFPEGRGDRGATARGMSGGNSNLGTGGRIAVRVPSAYRNDPGTFLGLMRGVQIDQAYPEEYARQYIAGMQTEPALADELSYCLEALGPKAIPFAREMYDSAESVPQLAALRAGVGLGDARAANFLKTMAAKGPDNVRSTALKLLGTAKAGPSIEIALQELLKEDQLTVRVAAYEALARRAERAQFARLLETQLAEQGSQGRGASPVVLEDLASVSLPAGTIQGVTRIDFREKFTLDLVPIGEPLVYITQQGRPRIVIFGDRPKVEKPVLVSTWSGRFTLVARSESEPLRLQYRAPQSPRAVTMEMPEDLKAMIEILARKTTPEDPRPGLDMSYSEVVGVLYAMHKEGASNAAFATERDRLLADLLSAAQSDQVKERPETSKDIEELVVFDKPQPTGKAKADDSGKKPQIMPIEQAPKKKDGGKK